MTLPAGVTSESYPAGAVNFQGMKASGNKIVIGLANHAAKRNSFSGFFHLGNSHDAKSLIFESEPFLKSAVSHVKASDTVHLVYVVTSAEMGRHVKIAAGQDALAAIGLEAEKEMMAKISSLLPQGCNVVSNVIRAPYQSEGLVTIAVLQDADLIVCSENTEFTADRDYLLKHSPVPVVIIKSQDGSCVKYSDTGLLGLTHAVEAAKTAKDAGVAIHDMDHAWVSSVQYWDKGVDEQTPAYVHDDVKFDEQHRAAIQKETSFNH